MIIESLDAPFLFVSTCDAYHILTCFLVQLCISEPKSTLAIWSRRISIWKTTSQFHGSTFDFRRYMQFVINAVADLLQFFIRKCYSRWTLDNSTLILNKKKRTFKHDQMNAVYNFYMTWACWNWSSKKSVILYLSL